LQADDWSTREHGYERCATKLSAQKKMRLVDQPSGKILFFKASNDHHPDSCCEQLRPFLNLFAIHLMVDRLGGDDTIFVILKY
jgi:hypothetical protein